MQLRVEQLQEFVSRGLAAQAAVDREIDRELARATSIVVCPKDPMLAASAARIARAHFSADTAVERIAAPGESDARPNRASVVYVGRRLSNGRAIVKVRVRGSRRERVLPKRFDLRRHSPSGFEWGYGGSGAAQLALAILAFHAGKATALDCYQDFKFLVVSALCRSGWTLTAAEVDAALEQIYAHRRNER